MKEKVSNVILGIVLVVMGIILCGKAFSVITFDLFSNGWWTLFIIIPFLIKIFTDKANRSENVTGLAIGIILLLFCAGIISFSVIFKLFVPTVIILFGLYMMFKDSFYKKIEQLDNEPISGERYTALFSGYNLDFENEIFSGAELTAIFGGVKLDIRNAVIEEDITVNANCIFGGIDIYVPKNVNVKVKSNSIFCGISNDKKHSNEDISTTIYINANCMFGGVKIR